MSKYSKFIVAAIGAALTWAIAKYPDNRDVQDWLSLATAVLTALGVYTVRNEP